MNKITISGITLAACVLAAVGGLSLVHSLTRSKVTQAQNQWLLKSLTQVLPAGPYDNDPLQTPQWTTATELGSKKAVPLYTIYQLDKPYAAVLTVVAPDGYNGAIKLLLGVHYNGEIIGVRVTDHRETPGLGDDIDYKRSAWITNFNGNSLLHSTPRDWAVKKQGGKFDSFTGATITPRAVISAIHRALQWYLNNRDSVFPI